MCHDFILPETAFYVLSICAIYCTLSPEDGHLYGPTDGVNNPEKERGSTGSSARYFLKISGLGLVWVEIERQKIQTNKIEQKTRQIS